MDKNQPLLPPSINESVNGPVPDDLYTVRVLPKCEVKKSGSGLVNLNVPFEILSPDVMPFPTEENPEAKVKVGGRRGRLYITVDPMGKSYSDACSKLRELGLANEDEELVPAEMLAKLNTGQFCLFLLLASKQKFARRPAIPPAREGELIKHPLTGQPIAQGWEFDYIDLADIIGVAETPDNLPPVGGKNAGF